MAAVGDDAPVAVLAGIAAAVVVVVVAVVVIVVVAVVETPAGIGEQECRLLGLPLAACAGWTWMLVLAAWCHGVAAAVVCKKRCYPGACARMATVKWKPSASAPLLLLMMMTMARPGLRASCLWCSRWQSGNGTWDVAAAAAVVAVVAAAGGIGQARLLAAPGTRRQSWW